MNDEDEIFRKLEFLVFDSSKSKEQREEEVKQIQKLILKFVEDSKLTNG